VDIHSFRDRLDGLDALLRDYGMGCGVDVWQSVFLLLARLEQQGRLPDNPQQLAPLLGPLFCRNPEEQARFPVLFEQWLNDGQGPSIATNNRLVTPEQTVMTAERAKIKRTGWIWTIGILTLLAVYVAGILFWPKQQPVVLPPPQPEAATQSVQPPKITSVIQMFDQVAPRLLPEPIKLDETLQQDVPSRRRIHGAKVATSLSAYERDLTDSEGQRRKESDAKAIADAEQRLAQTQAQIAAAQKQLATEKDQAAAASEALRYGQDLAAQRNAPGALSARRQLPGVAALAQDEALDVADVQAKIADLVATYKALTNGIAELKATQAAYRP
jgi:hypothetical protein